MIAGVGEGETFQFLGRNSGRSDSTPPQTSSQTAREVSIPRSEFWSFGPGAAAYAAQSLVSGFNSSVGILVVRTIGLIEVEISNSSVFQFLGRNSGRSDLEYVVLREFFPGFQFLGRNSGRSDLGPDAGTT